ncbi:MAG: hypothetical protein GXO03_03600 [Aquificae bacterium]|nr:hypothetical protein [Aquificota bacterium]
MPAMFKENALEAVPGEYPLTAENLFRVGLALATLLILDRELERPVLGLDEPNFATLALATGFVNAGGDAVFGKEGDLTVRTEKGERWRLAFKELSERDVKKLESLLFGRYPIPKRTGRDIGQVRCSVEGS